MLRKFEFPKLASFFSRKSRRGRSLPSSQSLEPLEPRVLLTVNLPSGRPQFEPNEVLVQYFSQTSTAARQQVYNAVGGRRLETIRTPMMVRTGAGDLERISLGAGMGIDRAIEALKRNPNVASVSPNYIFQRAAISNDPYYTTNSNLWGMYGSDSPSAVGPSNTTNQFGIDAERAWNENITGSANVVVGIIDEGIQVNHPDLQSNIWVNPYDPVDGIDNDGNGYVDDVNGWDFVYNNNSVYDAGEDAHGTHVAGTIGGVGGNGVGVAGVNWDVTMIAAKFLGPNGGSLANAVKAVDYLTDLKIRHGINMVATNNSWGGGGYSQSLHDAIIRAAKRDILFVAAAGNSTSNNDTTASYPSNYNTTIGTSTQTAASYDGVIAVASITNTGAISSFSSYGATTVDIGAPGSSINSSVPVSTYANYNGTSMATPHVTGAAALFASLQSAGVPGATIRSALLDSATPTTSLSGKTVTGGRLNVYNALQRATSIRMDKSSYGLNDTITVSVLSPAANLNSGSVETITAQLTSTTETIAEVITLTETGANTGVFVGTILTASGTMVADGKLQVGNGNQITAFNSNVNKTATATVDGVAPTITLLTSTPRANSADIKWTTNELATTEVVYGTSSTNLSSSLANSTRVTSHTATLTGLSPATTYYYRATSRDAAGNVTTSAIQSFTTSSPAPILFVDDDHGATYERFFNSALQANSYTFDTWNVASIGSTPTASQLAPYRLVVWNTGYDYSSAGAGLAAAEQSAIQGYLDGGGRIFISGQDILYNGVTTTFRTNYLKVSASANDVSNVAHTETGVTGNAVSNGQSLSVVAPSDFPSLYVDALSPATGAEGTYLHGVSTSAYPFSAVNYRGNYAAGGFGVVFSTLPFDSISTSAANPNNQASVMKRVVEYLNGTTVAGISVSAASSSATTTELGGQVTFSVVLDSAPTADVTIPVSSSDETEGAVNVASLTFTSSNWSTPQTVTVTGQNDFIDDGNIAYSVVLGAAISSDSLYNGKNAADVSLTNQDNDTAGVTVSAPSPGNQTSENLTSVSFTIRLDSEPTASVSIGLSSSDLTEGTVNVPSVTFTAANWSVPQTITVTGVNDDLYDGNIAYTIVTVATSVDTLYNNRTVTDVALVNLDNDSPPPTKFYVVDDGTTDRTFEYTANGAAVENYALTNTASRGAAMTSAGDKVWVVDKNRKVYVYNTSGALLSSWTAGTLATTATVEGIATDGQHIWIVDAKSDRVFYYANAAASTTSGVVAASGNWVLGSGNTGPKDVVYGSDGTKRYLWVVNDASTDKVFRYVLNANGSIITSTTGTDPMVSWNLNSVNKAPTGITLDPSQTGGSLWIVDSGTDTIYEYMNARGTTQGVLSSVSFRLSATNTNPQGIADPPPVRKQINNVNNSVQRIVASAMPGQQSTSRSLFRSRSAEGTLMPQIVLQLNKQSIGWGTGPAEHASLDFEEVLDLLTRDEGKKLFKARSRRVRG